MPRLFLAPAPVALAVAAGAVLAAVAGARATLAVVVADTIAVGVLVAGARAGNGAAAHRVVGRRCVIGSCRVDQRGAMVADTIAIGVHKGLAGALMAFRMVVAALGGAPLPSPRRAIVVLLHGRGRNGTVVNALRAGRESGKGDGGDAQGHHERYGDDKR